MLLLPRNVLPYLIRSSRRTGIRSNQAVKTPRHRYGQIAALLWSVLVGCGTPPGSEPPAKGKGVDFPVYFAEVDRVQLLEVPGDPIGDIGTLNETRGGEYLVTDPVKSRVLRFDQRGALIASFGRYGEGPFEFGRVSGIAERSDGKVVVPDSRRGRITILTSDLQPDTSFTTTPRPLGQALPMSGGVVLSSTGTTTRIPAGRSSQFAFTIRQDSVMWAIPAPSPGPMQTHPYWDSYATTPAAATSTAFFVAYSLTYPILRYDAKGTFQDSLGTMPPSFRRAPLLKAGAFAGSDGIARVGDWLEKFDIISDLATVGDTLLIVTHGVLRNRSTGVDANEHRHVDVYHAVTGRKLAEDVLLPQGSRVLGGGRTLLLLVSQPPGPWVVARYQFKPTTTPPLQEAQP